MTQISDRKLSVSAKILISVCISVLLSVSLHLLVLAEISVQNQTKNRNLMTYHSHILTYKEQKKNSNICSQTFFIKHFLNISGVGFKLVVRTLSNHLFNSSSLDIEVLGQGRSFENRSFEFLSKTG